MAAGLDSAVETLPANAGAAHQVVLAAEEKAIVLNLAIEREESDWDRKADSDTHSDSRSDFQILTANHIEGKNQNHSHQNSAGFQNHRNHQNPADYYQNSRIVALRKLVETHLMENQSQV